MLKFFLLIFIFSLIYSQSRIVVYASSDDSKMARFEKELIILLTDLYKKRTKLNIPLDIRPIINLGKHIQSFKNETEAPDILYLSINIISITEERLKVYDISNSYMPNKYAFLAKKTLKKLRGRKAGYLTGTVLEEIAEKAEAIDLVNIIPFNTREKRLEAFYKGDIDIMITDYVDSWTYNLKVIKEIDYHPKDFYGIYLVKNNPYNEIFLEVANYYLKSLAYFKLIKKHFGVSAIEYFKQNRG